MSYIDVKYLNLLSSMLPLFKKKGDNLWNFRCPYCGDSKKSRTKARGFVFRKKNDLFFKCHNCGVGASLGNLIKHLDLKTYDDYIMERYKLGVKTNNPEPDFKEFFSEPIVFPKKDIFKTLQSISQLSKSHPAREVVRKREIPESFYISDLYLCKSFYKFTNTLIPNKFPSLEHDHPRLIIAFRDERGEIFAYQGRAFGSEIPKYITIKLNEDSDKIYGLDRVNNSKEIYVVEGPIDSMFLDNCIAVGGSDFSKPLVIAGKIVDNAQLTIVFDNEPRNKEICKQIEKTLNQGRKMVIWPDSMKHKDINDMILAGYTKENIKEIIIDNTFSGAAAQLRFSEWRKINA
jgi:transcription elongation factor Elf1